LILDALHAACGADRAKVIDASLIYFQCCSGVSALTLVHTAQKLLELAGHDGSEVHASGTMLAVWILAASKLANQSAVEQLVKGHVAAVRALRMGDRKHVVEALFLMAVEATLAALQIAAVAALPLAAGMCDALVAVHSDILVASADCRRAWQSVTAMSKQLGSWCLDSIAPRMGMVSAHCGATFTAKKEAQFLPNAATRITTSKEADIQKHVVVLQAPKTARANKAD
jgi:hypothetical protein